MVEHVWTNFRPNHSNVGTQKRKREELARSSRRDVGASWTQASLESPKVWTLNVLLRSKMARSSNYICSSTGAGDCNCLQRRGRALVPGKYVWVWSLMVETSAEWSEAWSSKFKSKISCSDGVMNMNQWINEWIWKNNVETPGSRLQEKESADVLFSRCLTAKCKMFVFLKFLTFLGLRFGHRFRWSFVQNRDGCLD